MAVKEFCPKCKKEVSRIVHNDRCFACLPGDPLPTFEEQMRAAKLAGIDACAKIFEDEIASIADGSKYKGQYILNNHQTYLDMQDTKRWLFHIQISRSKI